MSKEDESMEFKNGWQLTFKPCKQQKKFYEASMCGFIIYPVPYQRSRRIIKNITR